MSERLPSLVGAVATLEALLLGWLTAATWVSSYALSTQAGGLLRANMVLLGVTTLVVVLFAGGASLIRDGSAMAFRPLASIASAHALLLVATLGGVLDWVLYGNPLLVGAFSLITVLTAATAVFALHKQAQSAPALVEG